MFLFGQAPLGVAVPDPWFADAALDAFVGSQQFWCEVADDPRLTDPELLAQFGLSATALSATVDSETRTRLAVATELVGIDVASLDGCRPWLAAQILDNALRSIVVDVDLVDAEGELTRRSRAAGKEVRFEFADAEAVLSYFACLGRAEVEYLDWTADRVAKGTSELLRQAHAWLAGDIRVFEDEVQTMSQERPALYERLLRLRNHEWLPRIHAMASIAGDAFVLMGMSHLVGDEGVLAILERHGDRVERLM